MIKERTTSNTKSYAYTRPKFERMIYRILYISLLVISIIFTIYYYTIWILPVVLFSFSILIISYLEMSEYFFTPIEIQILKDTIILRYRCNKEKKMMLSDILWLNVWPGDNKCYAYAQVKFDDGKLYPISMSYEAGRALKDTYIDTVGEKPPNYYEYNERTGSTRWFSSGPSE